MHMAYGDITVSGLTSHPLTALQTATRDETQMEEEG
jgi:hypothetical protein